MARIVNPRSVRARERWAGIVEEQRRSGLGVRAFCLKRGVGEHSFYAWRRRLRGARPATHRPRGTPRPGGRSAGVKEPGYRLFDRRCRTETALGKLAKLRERVRRFKKVGKTLSKLFSPNLEKALTFLDDRLLPSTSNAVERGNRRHRKMQKSIYRVRTKPHVSGRIAQDMLREARTQTRADTTQVLHLARAA